jgi:hypothetical protein
MRAEPFNTEHTSRGPDPLTAALHVTNGDCTDLAGTGLVHRSLVWFDVLHEGPVPAVGDDEFRCIRAAYLTFGLLDAPLRCRVPPRACPRRLAKIFDGSQCSTPGPATMSSLATIMRTHTPSMSSAEC